MENKLSDKKCSGHTINTYVRTYTRIPLNDRSKGHARASTFFLLTGV